MGANALSKHKFAGIRFAETCELEENKLLAQKQAVAELLKDYDGVKAAALEKEKLGDRLYALLDAAIKKLDATYSANNIENKKLDRLREAKSRYHEAGCQAR